MPFTYPTVSLSLNGNNYPVYGDVADADNYLLASITAASWLTAGDDTKAQALIGATRWLNGLNWIGQLVDSGQAHAWPRTNIINVNSSTIPLGVVWASFEIAAGLVDDPTLFTSMNEAIPKTLTAGPVSVAFFRPRDVQWLGPVPKAALVYILPYLGSKNAAGGPIPSGYRRTELPDDFDFQHGL
jgi:hypothetical protein